MGYFYLSSRTPGPSEGPHSMSTRELRRTLQRKVLIKRYQLYADGLDASSASASSPGADDGAKHPVESGFPHVSDHQMMVMVDEETGNKYMRAVEKKGLGYDGGTSWIVKGHAAGA